MKMNILMNIMNLFIENGNFFVSKILRIFVLFIEFLFWIMSLILKLSKRFLNIVVKIGWVVMVFIWWSEDLIIVSLIILIIVEIRKVLLIYLYLKIIKGMFNMIMNKVKFRIGVDLKRWFKISDILMILLLIKLLGIKNNLIFIVVYVVFDRIMKILKIKWENVFFLCCFVGVIKFFFL